LHNDPLGALPHTWPFYKESAEPHPLVFTLTLDVFDLGVDGNHWICPPGHLKCSLGNAIDIADVIFTARSECSAYMREIEQSSEEGLDLSLTFITFILLRITHWCSVHSQEHPTTVKTAQAVVRLGPVLALDVAMDYLWRRLIATHARLAATTTKSSVSTISQIGYPNTPIKIQSKQTTTTSGKRLFCEYHFIECRMITTLLALTPETAVIPRLLGIPLALVNRLEGGELDEVLMAGA
jgi:hypothetical protein